MHTWDICQKPAFYLIKRIWTWNDFLLGRSIWLQVVWICYIASVIHHFLLPFNCRPVWTFDASLMERCVWYCVFSQRRSRVTNFLENKPQGPCFVKLEVLAFEKLVVLTCTYFLNLYNGKRWMKLIMHCWTANIADSNRLAGIPWLEYWYYIGKYLLINIFKTSLQ